MIVVLNGLPGTGKHTIVQQVQALLPADKASRLVDNRLLIDPVQVLFPDRGDDRHALRRKLVGEHGLLEPGPPRGGLANLGFGSLDTNGEVDESSRLLMVGLPIGAE
ncbi:hypothetical protein PHLGIDRAFT_114371 [Phlebiopsis gigantea 11061_1 CR5-6]|uniref:Uncharacterized protein n=1 Tax=Phlebiopsis gigantea (strain 11061_1 CR5-6) TaxID=745531 RepID=A0A0C3SF59_PHLG1|nr:hypothetical protein PHLGIDRAFT_114371 [Phlebiopsis gigantea 11061_1 CR5-6]